MIPPIKNNEQHNGFSPPEWGGGIPFTLNMNDGLQSAYAEQMQANAEHRKEETKTLRTQNKWSIIRLKLTGFFVYAAILGLGVAIGYFIL